jgi:hypothetical protein
VSNAVHRKLLVSDGGRSRYHSATEHEDSDYPHPKSNGCERLTPIKNLSGYGQLIMIGHEDVEERIY